MSEIAKTTSFVVVAVLAGAVAWFTQPQTWQTEPEDMKNQMLFSDFQDPLAATSLEIVQYDEDTASVRPFKVAKVKNRWVIPSHDNYPADAKDQLAEAAAGLIDLKVLSVAGNEAGDHAQYGVVDPDPKTLQAGATGVGTRVVLRDAADKVLVGLVIGKQLKDSKNAELYYVRRVGQDPVYVVALKNTSKLSSRFEDWIEKDLLKLNAWDIQQVEIRDYSVDTARGVLNHRGEMTVQYNDTGDPRWKMIKERRLDPAGKFAEVKFPADEEMNSTALDDMKNAMDDLKIVDVRPKPKGLSAELKAAADFLNNRQAVDSLAQRGFHAVQLGGQAEILSNQGEIRCRMKDGVEYLLRFGDIAADSGGGKKTPDAKADEKDAKSVNRYILVMAQFDKDAIAKPDLEKLPPLPDEKKPEAKDEAKKDEKKPDEKPGDKKADAKPEAAKDEKKADEKPDAKPEAKKDEKPDDTAVKAERERIEKENKRKQEEYDEKVKKGEEQVKELNTRFADWYYVISDDVYKKIHVGRDQIVKKKEKKDEKDDAAKSTGSTPGDFDALKASAPGKE